IIAVIDKLVPLFANPHESHRVEETRQREHAAGPIDPRSLGRIGVLTALAIAIHNFPEGLATFLASVNEPSVGAVIAVAIAIHNIPEGIAVAVPVFYATGSAWRAFLAALTSGLAEPLGGLLGFLVLWQVVGPLVFGVVFAAVAGVMVFISLDQLLPAARKYGEHHLTVYGLVAGKALMAVSLLLLAA
ncbi:MAG: ZIP family metal transporter, partial [Dehalococcoidia bacterium]|nr:ZIP family metal transporter [Dehalococcoidia bacterium]